MQRAYYRDFLVWDVVEDNIWNCTMLLLRVGGYNSFKSEVANEIGDQKCSQNIDVYNTAYLVNAFSRNPNAGFQCYFSGDLNLSTCLAGLFCWHV